MEFETRIVAGVYRDGEFFVAAPEVGRVSRSFGDRRHCCRSLSDGRDLRPIESVFLIIELYRLGSLVVGRILRAVIVGYLRYGTSAFHDEILKFYPGDSLPGYGHSPGLEPDLDVGDAVAHECERIGRLAGQKLPGGVVPSCDLEVEEIFVYECERYGFVLDVVFPGPVDGETPFDAACHDDILQSAKYV